MLIHAQKLGSLTEQELRDIAALLLKGGYTVSLTRIKKEDGKLAKALRVKGDDDKAGGGQDAAVQN